MKDHKAPDVGDYYIDLTAKDTAGIEHKISDYKSEFILLDFWSSGCPACDASLADLKILNKKYNDKLTIISFSQVIHEPFWRDVSKDQSLSWVNLSDGKGRFGGSGYLYGIKGVPTFILLDSNGKIIERWSGYGEGIFEMKLSKYLEK